MTGDTINPGASVEYKLLQQAKKKLGKGDREVNAQSLKKNKSLYEED